MDTGALGRARGDRGATAVENWSFRRSNYFRFVGEECRNVMENVGLQDMSAFANAARAGTTCASS